MARPRIIKDPVKLTLYLPAATKRLLAAIAREFDTSLSGAVTRLIRSKVSDE
jgi:hypothetical protein